MTYEDDGALKALQRQMDDLIASLGTEEFLDDFPDVRRQIDDIALQIFRRTEFLHTPAKVLKK